MGNIKCLIVSALITVVIGCSPLRNKPDNESDSIQPVASNSIVWGNWSKTERGLRARLGTVMPKTLDQERPNDYGIVKAYLEICSESNLSSPIYVEWERARKQFSVVNELDNEVPGAIDSGDFCYSGFQVERDVLVLPCDSVLRFNICQRGLCSSPHALASLDFGASQCWELIAKHGKNFFLSLVISIDKKLDIQEKSYWYGRLEIPKVAIPLMQETLMP